MATIAGKFLNDSGVTELEGSLVTDDPVNASSLNGVTASDVPAAAGEYLRATSASAAAWTPVGVRIAAGVPAGAPAATEFPLAFDSTAVTGGFYVWNGAAWVKVADIP